MNHCQERGQPCPREPNFQDSRTRLSALLSVDGSSSQCMRKKRKRALHEPRISARFWSAAELRRFCFGLAPIRSDPLRASPRHSPPKRESAAAAALSTTYSRRAFPDAGNFVVGLENWLGIFVQF